MKLIKFIQLMVVVTVVALIYVHMQMSIFSLAYEGKRRERRITELKEGNGSVKYEILELKSANYLGEKLLRQGRDLKFCDQESVVKIKTPQRAEAAVPQLAAQEPNPIWRFLTFRAQAEARAAEHRSPKPRYQR